mgnify:CR=1 FL=1
MGRHVTTDATRKKRVRYVCRQRKRCAVKSIYENELFDAIIEALQGNVVEIREKVSSGAHSGREIKEAQLAALLEKMEALEEKEDYLYELLEKKEYTPEVFNRRRAKLVKDMDATRAAIEKAREDLPEPERPVKTTSLSRGISTSIFLRLCSLAPLIIIFSFAKSINPF